MRASGSRSDQPPGRLRRLRVWLRHTLTGRLTTGEDAETYLAEREIAPLLRGPDVRGDFRRDLKARVLAEAQKTAPDEVTTFRRED